MKNVYTVQIRMETETAHRLLNHPGLCRNIHGHSYRWTVVVGALTLTGQGMVTDFSTLKTLVKGVLDKYDHALVLQNSDPFLGNPNIGERIVIMNEAPTAENMANCVASEVKGVLDFYDRTLFLLSVKVRETTNNEAAWYAVLPGE